MIRENALSIRELTVGGLFAALITAGAWVKITLPTQPLPMHYKGHDPGTAGAHAFYAAVVFCAACGAFAE